MPRISVGAAPDVVPSGEEATNPPAARIPLLTQPSTWSAIWALVALALLAIIRGELRRRAGG